MIRLFIINNCRPDARIWMTVPHTTNQLYIPWPFHHCERGRVYRYKISSLMHVVLQRLSLIVIQNIAGCIHEYNHIHTIQFCLIVKEVGLFSPGEPEVVILA